MSTAAECSAPHSGETGRGDRQVYGGRASERAGGSGNMEKIGQIWGGEVVDGLECYQKDFELNPELNWEPV